MRLQLSSPSLAGRLLLASALLAALLGAVFVVLFAAVVSSRDATRGEERASDLTEATFALDRLVLDVDTGVRGFVLTGEKRFLQPWRRAQNELPAELDRFERLAVADSESAADARTLVQRVRRYISDYS